MIPRVARLGTGFSGAGLYYLHDQRPDNRSADLGKDDNARPAAGDYMLHDKKGAQTSHRVGFTATLNLPTTDPQKALRCMSWLAGNAQNVRQAAVGAAAKAAGMSYADYVKQANPYRGRKGQKPVYTLSIAWHPTKNKKPSKEDMIQAADEVLKTLGLEDRQALIVEHTDTKHPHIHLIVNRVSPVNGKYASVSNDYLRLSKWALDYERRTGLVLCHERMFRWRERDKQRLAKQEKRRTDSKAKGRYVRSKDVPRRDHEWFKKHAHLSPDEIRSARATRQEKEVEKFALKQAAALLRFDQKLKRTIGRDLKKLKAEIAAKEKQLVAMPVRTSSPKGSPLSVMRKVGAMLTAKHFFQNRALTSMLKSADNLSQMMEANRQDKRKQLGRYWKAMEKRHIAERRRDEERIARMKSKRRSEATGERGRKQFNVRGDDKAARHTTARPQVHSLNSDHNKVARAKPKAKASKQVNRKQSKRQIADTGAMAVLAEGLQLFTRPKKPLKPRRASNDQLADTGIFAVFAEALQRLVGPKKSAPREKPAFDNFKEPLALSAAIHMVKKTYPEYPPARRPDKIVKQSVVPEVVVKTEPLTLNDKKAKEQDENNNQYSSESREGGADYEARVASRIENLERKEKKKRKRRKRKRPRGKVRRME